MNEYEFIRENGAGFFEQKNGLIEVSGKEAVQFLNGLITNDVKALEDKTEMLAAFPNAQGRLLAMVRVWRDRDKFAIQTDEQTHAKVFQNLFRFTYAGDFFVKDLSEEFRFFTLFGNLPNEFPSDSLKFQNGVFVPENQAEDFKNSLSENGASEISDETYEILRIERGEPKYGVDMDETTVVLETGIDEAVSFTKGCYIGQEIIARIHFRGHVAKQLSGLVLEDLSEPSALADGFLRNAELKSSAGKAAGKITSSTFSPKLNKRIALAYVRYEFLAENTELKIIHEGQEFSAKVAKLPFV